MLTILRATINRGTLYTWLRTPRQTLWRQGTSMSGFPMEWTPAGDRIFHGHLAVADWIVSTEAFLSGKLRLLSEECVLLLGDSKRVELLTALAVLRCAITMAEQVDDATLLLSWELYSRESVAHVSLVPRPERSPCPPCDGAVWF